MPTCVEKSQNHPLPQYRFRIHPHFNGDRLELVDQDLFPVNRNVNVLSDKNVPFHRFQNPYIDNEYRGFIQHLALDEHYAAGTLRQYVTCSGMMTAEFINTEYPELTSIIDEPFETLYPAYLEFLTDRDIKIVSMSIYRVDENMGTKTYPSKTHYVSGFTSFYRYIYSIAYPDDTPEYKKDCWDIRKLGIPFSTAVARKRWTINYENISQPWLREGAKAYNYFRIQHRTMSAVLDDMKALNIFSSFLKEQFPQITGLDEVSRDIIEAYFSYLSSKDLSPTTYNRRISAIRTFFSYGNMMDLDRFPEKPLIMNSDYRKIVHRMPKYFTDNELKQMNEHIAALPIQTARMFFILENCGMRVSDLCSSEISPNGRSCLTRNAKGEFIFEYASPKTHRSNCIPVSDVVGNVIMEAMEESKRLYGENTVYIFAASEKTAMSTETFSLHMNEYSQKYGMVKDDGSPLRIKGHTFRGTVATQYANCGISMDVIRMMLGQQKLGVLSHYVTIHQKEMVEYLRPITEENDRMIRSIGKDMSNIADEMEEPAFIPLSNGRCGKSVSSGICDHAFNCYTCRMFVPEQACIPVYRQQLREAENNIAIAELHGYDRILEINTKLRDVLKNILDRFDTENV